ncbi:MAG: cytochrome c3 family protein, partial [Thiohalomonadales bacterium]
NLTIKFKSFVVLVCFTISGYAYALEQDTDDNKECATCHIMWLSDFQNPDVATLIPFRGTPLEKSGRETDVASNERMCFSCHDGFILESRFRWRSDMNNHPVGGKVPDKIHIPNIEGKETFPLNLDKRIYCGTCHTAHGIDWTQNTSAIFMRAINSSSNMCRACHADHATGTQEGNHPILDPIKNFPTVLSKAGAKIGPGNKMVCESCHRQHGAPGKKLLVIKNGSTSRLCRTCHRDKRSMVNSKHDLSVMRPNAKNEKGQTVRESGLCSACHVPHGAKGPALASRTVAPELDATLGTCRACHVKDGLAKKKIITNKHSHPLKVSVKKVGIRINNNKWTSTKQNQNAKRRLKALPLYDEQGNRSRSADLVACGTCHDPHNWSVKASGSYKKDPRTYTGTGNNSFLRITQGKNSNLCINCHVDKAAIIPTRHNPNAFKDERAKLMKRSGKRRLESGLCGTCHKAHNANGPAMWARNSGKGKSPIEKLCNDCHKSPGSGQEKLTGEFSHPVGKKLDSNVTIGKMPRFDDNGDRVKSGGNIDCSTCHDPHQWDPTNINSVAGANLKVDGTVNNSFLRFRLNAKAGLCLKCHKTQSQVAGTDHDLSITAPDARNALGQTVSESGICGTCHAVHNSRSSAGLWGRDVGPGDDPAAQVCFSCHAPDGLAGEKVIPNELATHPKDIMVWSGVIRKAAGLSNEAGMPVFNTKGTRSNVGTITCPSCHNPHLWSAKKRTKGPGRNLEGDSSSSFLTLKSVANNVCSDCHGLDALFRYKYFHSKSAREKHTLFE